MRSRIRQTKEQEAKRNLFLSIAGLAVLLVVIVVFGIPFLINLSLFVEKKIDPNGTNQSTTDAFVPPPILDISYTATNSGVIIVGGSGQKGQTIYLYVNNDRVADQEVSDDSTFAFDNIRLKEGENELFAKAKEGKNTSETSNTAHINYIKDAPDLGVDSPADGQVFHGGDEKMITVAGKTRDGAKVTVNGFWAVMQPNGTYTYRLTLQDGDNQIKIVSEDEAGNKTEKSIKVNFAP